MSDTAQNGKGSRPRNCFSKEYHNNYADIEWGHKNPKTIDDYWDKPKTIDEFCDKPKGTFQAYIEAKSKKHWKQAGA